MKMAHIDNRNVQLGAGARIGVVADEGLRAYMLRVYNYMAGGVFVTGIVAYLTSSAAITTSPAGAKVLTQFGQLIYVSPLRWVIMLAPLAFVFFISFRIYKMSVTGAQLAFWLFAAAMGLSLSSIFLVFTGQSITQVFFVTAAAFGGLSLYGYTTQRDLSGWGSFLIMGVFGIIIAALVNLFVQSSALQFAIAVIGVLVFAGLTAYDTQRIKDGYYELMGDMTATSKAAIMGALSLYLDFINMFMLLLQLFGRRQ
jgi:FtsH-binding integral membrane protein